MAEVNLLKEAEQKRGRSLNLYGASDELLNQSSPGTVLYFDFLLCEITNSLLIKSTKPKFLVKLKAH